jgi:hypothetical protein
MKSILREDIPTYFLTGLAVLRNFDLGLDLVPGVVEYESSNIMVPGFLLYNINCQNTGAITACSLKTNVMAWL